MGFKIQNLDNFFTEVYPTEKQVGYDFCFQIIKNGSFIADICYMEEFNEIVSIKDNFPMPRKSYHSVNLPFKTKEYFKQLLSLINIELNEKNN